MAFALPQTRYRDYADYVCQRDVSEIRLADIVRKLAKDKDALPSDADLRIVLGIALFRLGRIEEGLSELRTAVRIGTSADAPFNLVAALERAQRFDEALQLCLDGKVPRGPRVLVFGIMAGNLSDEVTALLDPYLRKLAIDLLASGQIDHLRQMLSVFFTPDLWNIALNFELDSSETPTKIYIRVGLEGPPENVAAESIELTQKICAVTAPETLKRIVPLFEVFERK